MRVVRRCDRRRSGCASGERTDGSMNKSASVARSVRKRSRSLLVLVLIGTLHDPFQCLTHSKHPQTHNDEHAAFPSVTHLCSPWLLSGPCLCVCVAVTLSMLMMFLHETE